MTPEELEEKKRQLLAQSDAAEEMVIEFHFGLAQVLEAAAQAGTTGRRRKRVATPDPCVDYCHAFLARMDEQEQSARAAGTPLTAIDIGRVTVLLELSQIDIKTQAWSESEDHLHRAYTYAKRAGSRVWIYRVLNMLGSLHWLAYTWDPEYEHLLDSAEHFLKEALPYAGWTGRYPDMMDVYYWLGVVYQNREATLPQAVLMFDLASRFGPLGHSSLLEKQQCRLRLGERKALLAELKPADDARGYDFASALAAAEALKRRKLRPQILARAIEAARQNEEADWLKWFEREAAEATTR